MATIEGLKHAKCIHQKLHFWKFLWTVCSTTQSTVDSMTTRMMSTVFRCSRNRLSSWSPLCWFNEYVHVRMVVLQCRAVGFLKVQVLVNKFCLFRAFYRCQFLHDFQHMRCHIQGQGFGNKMYISESFTVVGYLHTAGFKNCRGINCAKCIHLYIQTAWQMKTKWSFQHSWRPTKIWRGVPGLGC